MGCQSYVSKILRKEKSGEWLQTLNIYKPSLVPGPWRNQPREGVQHEYNLHQLARSMIYVDSQCAVHMEFTWLWAWQSSAWGKTKEKPVLPTCHISATPRRPRKNRSVSVRSNGSLAVFFLGFFPVEIFEVLRQSVGGSFGVPWEAVASKGWRRRKAKWQIWKWTFLGKLPAEHFFCFLAVGKGAGKGRPGLLAGKDGWQNALLSWGSLVSSCLEDSLFIPKRSFLPDLLRADWTYLWLRVHQHSLRMKKKPVWTTHKPELWQDYHHYEKGNVLEQWDHTPSICCTCCTMTVKEDFADICRPLIFPRQYQLSIPAHLGPILANTQPAHLHHVWIDGQTGGQRIFHSHRSLLRP